MAMQLLCMCMGYMLLRALALFQFSGFFDKDEDPEYGTTSLCKEGYQVKGIHTTTERLEQHPNIHVITMASKQLMRAVRLRIG